MAEELTVKASPPPGSSPNGKGKEREEENDGAQSGDSGVDGDEIPPEEAHLGRKGDDMNEEEVILIATIRDASITGVEHCRTGLQYLKTKSPLELKRDPTNIYDQWAIEMRVAGKSVKVGRLSKKYASRLAPLMDRGLVELEAMAGEVPAKTMGLKALPCILEIYGTRKLGRDERMDFAFPSRARRHGEKAQLALMKLEAEKMARVSSMVRSDSLGGSSTASGLSDTLMHKSVLIDQDDRPRGDVLGELFKEGADDPSQLLVHPCPPGKRDKTMRTDLLTFQKQGLAWMIKMEHPQLPKTVDDPPVQLWQRKEDEEGGIFWRNLATGDLQREKPLLKRGGILADEMGLGKTMQTIALICTDDTGEGVLDEPEEPDERFDDMTLILCPLSVASNWTDQFHTHVGSKRLKWHLYHGEGRELTKKQLRNFDVIITTYQTLANERFADSKSDEEPEKKKLKLAKPKDGLLHSVKWRRVVLDEGHLIKNPKAKMSMAAADLKAERRWVLTGTPIVNSIGDLGAIISFLKLCKPLDERAKWARFIENPIKAGDDEGPKLLRALVSSTTLRRTKNMTNKSGEKLISLPELKFYQHKVKLSPEARKLYDEVGSEVSSIIKKVLDRGATANLSNMLQYLLRLRQIACDPSLCPESFIQSVRDRTLEAATERDSQPGLHIDTLELQDTLRRCIQEGNDDCLMCFDVASDPRITACSHIFCATCIEPYVDTYGRCPACRLRVDKSQVYEPAPETGVSAEEEEVLLRQEKEGLDGHAVAKIKELIWLLGKREPGVKSLVFSQWTSHLNLIEAALKKAGFVTCRFDGTMAQEKRASIISTFSQPLPLHEPKKVKLKKGEKAPPKPPSVMLISLKAGALGLNLTAASQVFLMDPWWQASIEQQAIDRVYRIGQTKPVSVFQLIAEDTVEDKVLQIQHEKEALISQAFSGNKSTEGRHKIESRMEDLRAIFLGES